jgi:hypothetical protein
VDAALGLAGQRQRQADVGGGSSLSCVEQRGRLGELALAGLRQRQAQHRARRAVAELHASSNEVAAEAKRPASR